jgi:hypothetical protein
MNNFKKSYENSYNDETIMDKRHRYKKNYNQNIWHLPVKSDHPIGGNNTNGSPRVCEE